MSRFRSIAALATVLVLMAEGGCEESRTPEPESRQRTGTPHPGPADPAPTERDQVSWIFATGWQPTDKIVEIKYSHPSTGFVTFEHRGGGWSKEIDGHMNDKVVLQITSEESGPVTCSIGRVVNGELKIVHSITARIAQSATCRYN